MFSQVCLDGEGTPSSPTGGVPPSNLPGRVTSGRSRISQRGGANFQGGDKNLLFGQIFPKNCMKMKEFGPRGGRASLAPPLRSANGYSHLWGVPPSRNGVLPCPEMVVPFLPFFQLFSLWGKLIFVQKCPQTITTQLLTRVHCKWDIFYTWPHLFYYE